MARHGALLFSFALIVMAVQPSDKPSTLVPILPAAPEFMCPTALAFLLLLLVIAIFGIGRYVRRHNLRRMVNYLFYSLVVIISLLLLLLMVWLMRSIPALPAECFYILGIITILISILFLVGIFWERLAKKLEGIMDQCEQLYWIIIYIVFNIGWAKALSSFSGDKFYLVFGFGLPWFFVFIFLIFRASWRTGRYLAQKPEEER